MAFKKLCYNSTQFNVVVRHFAVRAIHQENIYQIAPSLLSFLSQITFILQNDICPIAFYYNISSSAVPFGCNYCFPQLFIDLSSVKDEGSCRPDHVVQSDSAVRYDANIILIPFKLQDYCRLNTYNV